MTKYKLIVVSLNPECVLFFLFFMFFLGRGALYILFQRQSFPGMPIHPPGRSPGTREFENIPANAPRLGQMSCSNAQRYS